MADNDALPSAGALSARRPFLGCGANGGAIVSSVLRAARCDTGLADKVRSGVRWGMTRGEFGMEVAGALGEGR